MGLGLSLDSVLPSLESDGIELFSSRVDEFDCHPFKYVELDSSVVREKIQEGQIITKFFLSHLQPAGIFTKAIGENAFKELT